MEVSSRRGEEQTQSLLGEVALRVLELPEVQCDWSTVCACRGGEQRE